VTVIDVGRDPVTGRRRQHWRAHRRRQAAVAHLTATAGAVQAGAYVAPTKLRTGEFLERWLRDYAATWSPTTLDGHRRAIAQRLIPALGLPACRSASRRNGSGIARLG